MMTLYIVVCKMIVKKEKESAATDEWKTFGFCEEDLTSILK